MFAVPSTSEHGEDGFAEHQSFIKRTTKSILASNRGANVGIIRYGNETEVTLPLSKGSDVSEMFSNIVDSMEFKLGEQNISKVIQVGHKMLSSGRPGVRKYLVLGSGATKISQEDAQKASRMFQPDQYMSVIPTSVGEASSTAVLKEIASFPSD